MSPTLKCSVFLARRTPISSLHAAVETSLLDAIDDHDGFPGPRRSRRAARRTPRCVHELAGTTRFGEGGGPARGISGRPPRRASAAPELRSSPIRMILGRVVVSRPRHPSARPRSASRSPRGSLQRRLHRRDDEVRVLSADLKRHEAMIDAARAKGHGDVGGPVVVLLGAHQQICRRNCLPKLEALDIGVQRRSAA